MKKPFLRSLLAAVLAGILAGAPVSPALAQEPASNPAPQAPAKDAVPISLGVSKHNYDHSPKAFPHLFAPYYSQSVDPAMLTNSPRLEQLIRDGKLSLTMQDAIALALENSMDIVVQRYNPWLADTGLLRAKAGGTSFGGPGAAFAASTAAVPNLFYDPVLTQVIGYDYRVTPINNPFISGTAGTGTGGGVTTAGLASHAAFYNTSYQQAFATGTSFTASWNNTRASSAAANFFNPYVQSSLNFNFQQQLLNGAGRFINRRNILIAENNRKIADLAFAQQAITTVTNTVIAYWELVYARQNVQVTQQAVTVSEKLFNDNKKQLEIGTMAPLDVTRAESELSTNRQNLIVAQTVRIQDELVLKNDISKDPLASNLLNTEIIPIDNPDTPTTTEAASFEDAVKEAFAKRPDLQEQYFNLKNAEVDVRATKNALLPTATLNAGYSSSGLAGNSTILGPTVYTGPGTVPIFDANGNPVTVAGPNNTQVPIFVGKPTNTVVGTSSGGFGNAQGQIFHNNFPDYGASINLSIPIRNRLAQADNLHAQLIQRQFEAQVQQTKNNALLDVRATTVTLEQDRARVDAARKARELQKQTFEAEQKKYQLGASTVYQVILTQRDYITAQATELRALADLAEARANYERALGRTLEVNSVTIAGAKSGHIENDTLIPGTLNGQVVGTEELFKVLDQKKSGKK